MNTASPNTTNDTSELAPSRLWIGMVTLAFVLYTIPYTTNILPWANEAGFFPLRPAIYLILASAGCIFLTLGRRVDFTKTTLLVILLQVVYLFDAAVLGRYTPPSGAMHLVTKHGAALITAVTLAWFLGSVMRYTMLPVLASAALTIIISSLANFAEWFGVHEFSIVPGRAAGFHADPNNAAIAIIIALAIFITLNKNLWLSFALMGVSFVAVAITLSRSGIVAEVLLCGSFLVVALARQPRVVVKALAVTAPIVVASIALLISNMSSTALQDNDIKDRMGALLGKDSEKMESGERMKDLKDGVAAVRISPIVGHGVGSGATKWQPHNQIVTCWIDGGIFTVSLFMAILASLALKCVAGRGLGGLCLLSLLVFIPFSQILITNTGFWISAIILVQLTSTRFFSIQWFCAAKSEEKETPHSQPVALTNVHHA